MTLFILTETPAGYALLKSKDKKLLKRASLAQDAESAEGVCSLLRLKQFRKFENASTALEEVAALTEGKVPPMLASMLNDIKDEKKVSLAVADPKLGNAITKLPGLQITPVSDSSTADLYRAIREHLSSLIPELMPEELHATSLGLSHSLSRHKLKFSPDKVDTMVVSAVNTLDEMDKVVNTHAMRVKEWYGWHFPELARIVQDNKAYARIVLNMGLRSSASDADLSDILPEEIETAVKAAAEVSMGTEISAEDLESARSQAEQVVALGDYRDDLAAYLTSRMQSLAPNLTAIVGDLVGARLISHAGSLVNLAKSPASTIQILGAEKALFRALKTKHDTPKYGLIFHASLVGQATGKNKGKIARLVATKAALALRTDALSDWGQMGKAQREEPTEEEKMSVGVAGRAMVESRLRVLEGKPLKLAGVGIGPMGQKTTQEQPGKWEIKEARKYNPDADGISANATPLANGGDRSSKKRKLTEDASDVPAAITSDVESDSEADEEQETANGVGKQPEMDEKAAKKARKEEKAKRKAEKAAKKAEKAAKKAAKEAKKASGGEGKKRKAEDDVGVSKKSKKSKT